MKTLLKDRITAEQHAEYRVLCKKFNAYHGGSISDDKNPFVLDGSDFCSLDYFTQFLIELEGKGIISVCDTIEWIIAKVGTFSNFEHANHYYCVDRDFSILEIVDNPEDWSAFIEDDLAEIEAITLTD